MCNIISLYKFNIFNLIKTLEKHSFYWYVQNFDIKCPFVSITNWIGFFMSVVLKDTFNIRQNENQFVNLTAGRNLLLIKKDHNTIPSDKYTNPSIKRLNNEGTGKEEQWERSDRRCVNLICLLEMVLNSVYRVVYDIHSKTILND